MQTQPTSGPVSHRNIWIALGISLVLVVGALVFLLSGGRHQHQGPEDGAAVDGASKGAAAGRPDALGKAASKDAKKDAGKDEAPPEEIGPPLLSGRVTGDGNGIAGAKVHLFSVERIAATLEDLQKLAPQGGDLPDIRALADAIRSELVKLKDSAFTATTIADGTYAFRKLGAGGHIVLALADGWLFRYGDVVNVTPGRTEVLDLVLNRGERISGRVVDARGSGVPGAVVTAEYRPAGMAGLGLLVRKALAYINGEFLRGPFQTLTTADGAFSLASLPSGIYDVAAGLPRGIEARVQGVETGTDAVLIYLGNGAVLTGSFIDKAGEPAVGAALRLERQDEMIQLPIFLVGFGDLINSVNHLMGEGPRRKVLGPRGDFRFGPLAPGRYKLTVESGGFLPFSQTYELGWDQVLDLGALGLDRGEEITGIVRTEDGAPLAGAKVLVTPGRMNFMNMGTSLNDYLTAKSVALSDAKGAFRIGGLLGGKYRLTASFPGYVPGVKKDAATGGEPIELVLAKGFRVTGQVLEAGAGKPLAGVRISAEPPGTFAITGDDGRFVLDGVVPQDPARNPFDMRDGGMGMGAAPKKEEEKPVTQVRINAAAKGFMTSGESVELDPAGTEVSIELERVRDIRGHALDPEGKPAVGSLVRLCPAFDLPPGMDFFDGSLIFLATSVSDLEGKFAFSDFRGATTDANYRVVADHVIYARGMSENFKIPKGSDEGLDVEVRLQKGARIRGTVTDGRQSVANAVVRLQKARPAGAGDQGAGMFIAMLGLPKTGETAYAGREGTFDFGKVLPGAYTLNAEMAGFIDSQAQAVTVSAGDEQEVALVLNPGKEIAGSAVDGGGEPVEGARVRLLQEKTGEGGDARLQEAQKFFGGAYKSSRTVADGAFRIGGLPDGRYTVIVERQGFTPFQEKGVEAGRQAVKAVLVLSASLQGTVVASPGGTPVKSFRVQVKKKGEAGGGPGDFLFAREQSDPDGRFLRDDLEGGTYEVKIDASGFVPSESEVNLTPGTVAEAKFVLARAGAIRGVVLEAETGLPILGARIAVWGSDLTAERTEKAQRKGLSKDAKASGAVAPDPKEEDARAVADSMGQEWRGEKVYTSDDGSFLLEGVSAGAQTVFASHPSYISEFLDGVEVGLGQEVEVTFRIRKGLAISGHVKDGSGSPLKSRLVFVRGAGESNARVRKSAMTDDEGAFQVGGLEKGPYRVMVPQGAQGQEALEVDLQKDQTGLEFALPAP